MSGDDMGNVPELKACPFCGKQPEVYCADVKDAGECWSVSCGFCCSLCPKHGTKEEAIKAWNTRQAHSGELGTFADKINKLRVTNGWRIEIEFAGVIIVRVYDKESGKELAETGSTSLEGVLMALDRPLSDSIWGDEMQVDRCDIDDARAALSATPQPTPNSTEKLVEALGKIEAWCNSYPLSVFPEPNFKDVRKALDDAGLSLDAVSASNMRHVVDGIRSLVNAALTSLEAPGEKEKGEVE